MRLPTRKFLAVRHTRVCLAFVVLLLGTFGYVVVFELVAENGYLATQYPVGIAVATAATTQQCAVSGELGCRAAFLPLSQLPYCSETTPCEYFDASVASVELPETVLVATRIVQAPQTLVCQAADTECPFIYNTTGSVTDTLVADPEAMYVELLVQARGVTLGSVTAGSGGRTLLHVPSSTALCAAAPDAVDAEHDGDPTDSAPCYIPPDVVSGAYSLSLATLLAAAGVDLDSDGLRNTGLTLQVDVSHSNVRPWKGVSSGLTSLVDVRALKVAPHLAEPIYSDYPDRRTLLVRYGVTVTAVQTGTLGEGSVDQALYVLLSGFTLVWAAVAAVEAWVTQCLPDSNKYQIAVEDATADSWMVANALAEPLALLRQKLATLGLPTHGSKMDLVVRLLEHNRRTFELERRAKQQPSVLSRWRLQAYKLCFGWDVGKRVATVE